MDQLTDNLKDREKWVQDNADKFNDLGYKVRTAKEAEDLLIKNSAKFVEACILKAKALAAQNLAAEKYQEIIKKQAEIDAMPDTVINSCRRVADNTAALRVITLKSLIMRKPRRNRS